MAKNGPKLTKTFFTLSEQVELECLDARPRIESNSQLILAWLVDLVLMCASTQMVEIPHAPSQG